MPPDPLPVQRPLRLDVAGRTVARERARGPILGDDLAAVFTAKGDGALGASRHYMRIHEKRPQP